MGRVEPPISIVLPTYNGGRFLAPALDSCLGQTYRNLEVVVVVDGSTDETPRILAGYGDPRLRVVQHEVNRGLPEALNTGFTQARGEYLAWTSDDNRYAAEAMAVLAARLDARPDVSFVYSDFWRVDQADRIIEEAHAGPPDHLRWRNPVGYCFLYRREVYETLGDYDPQARLAEDLDYWLRVFVRFGMDWVQQRLYYYRVHGRSLTAVGYGAYEALRVAARVRRRWLRTPWLTYTRQVAAADVEEAFARYASGDLRGARRRLLRGLLGDPLWLRNRGVLSIGLRSLVGAARVSRG